MMGRSTNVKRFVASSSSSRSCCCCCCCCYLWGALRAVISLGLWISSRCFRVGDLVIGVLGVYFLGVLTVFASMGSLLLLRLSNLGWRHVHVCLFANWNTYSTIRPDSKKSNRWSCGSRGCTRLRVRLVWTRRNIDTDLSSMILLAVVHFPSTKIGFVVCFGVVGPTMTSTTTSTSTSQINDDNVHMAMFVIVSTSTRVG
mmetsp:Transcript_2997/g.6746  ORF Transcript_2997/g.6746 Transcript_2997/m.6746 type:complete len:200 (+) Transcript_2997:547-1146(+)